jgi:hypothetical protein
MAALSLYSIQALAEVITGGSNAAPPEDAVSPYRTGPKIEQFFKALGVDFHVSGSESRIRAVEERLARLIGEPQSAGSSSRSWNKRWTLVTSKSTRLY